MLLTWALPVTPDLASVLIKRSVVGNPGTTMVYRGLGTTFKSTGLRNGVTYRFVLVAIDKAGNPSQPVVVSATPKALLLAAPKPGARVAKPPLLRWAPVAAARVLQRPAVPERNQDPLGLARPSPASSSPHAGRTTSACSRSSRASTPGTSGRASAPARTPSTAQFIGKSSFTVVVPKKA